MGSDRNSTYSNCSTTRRDCHSAVHGALILSSQRRSPGRGRDGGYPPPPAQIRTRPTKTYGSYLEYLASNRTAGGGCKIRGDGIQRSA